MSNRQLMASSRVSLGTVACSESHAQRRESEQAKGSDSTPLSSQDVSGCVLLRSCQGGRGQGVGWGQQRRAGFLGQ